MELYLWEFNYQGVEGQIMLLHLPGSDLWFSDEGYKEENITNCKFTQNFWDSVKIEDEDKLTKIGVL